MDIKIYTVYHLQDQIKKYQLHETDNIKLYNTNENVENSINGLNPYMAELVLQYRIWKNNIKSDYIGFQHYRRILFDSEIRLNKCIDIINNNNVIIYSTFNDHYNSSWDDLLKLYRIENLKSDIDEFMETKNEYVQKKYKNFKFHKFIPKYCTFVTSWDVFKKYGDFALSFIDFINDKYNLQFNKDKWENFINDKTPLNKRSISLVLEMLFGLYFSTYHRCILKNNLF